MTDTVNHPAHYTGRGIGYECIDITQHQNFCTGNAIKYLWRYQVKGKPLEDLEKARWYTHRAMKRQETIDMEDRHCGIILRRLIETTSGYESAAWYGLLKNEWPIVLSSLDAMLERTENDTQTL
jgi:hypothetical protein|nr:MAG TPA: nucelotide kinase [Caudoviricetes sp.]